VKHREVSTEYSAPDIMPPWTECPKKCGQQLLKEFPSKCRNECESSQAAKKKLKDTVQLTCVKGARDNELPLLRSRWTMFLTLFYVWKVGH